MSDERGASYVLSLRNLQAVEEVEAEEDGDQDEEDEGWEVFVYLFRGLPKDCEALRHFEHARPGGDEVEL